MHLLCLGINHRTAPVELRERLAVPEKAVPEAGREILAAGGIDECVVLSTCNRVEVYAAGPEAFSPEIVASQLRGHIDPEGRNRLDEALYRHSDREALRHLCRVVSGLDSMVLGETEIFGQVKKAYAGALESGFTGRLLNPLFQKIFQVGKAVRNETGIQHGSTSIGSVAVDLAEKIFGRLSKSRVMILGAGEMARTVSQSLVSRGAQGILVSNRSYDRALDLAGRMNAEAIRFDDWSSRIVDTDIVVCSTSAPHVLLTPDMVEPTLRARKGRPLFVIDIAVPRDADAALHDLDGVYLYDIDHLEAIAEEARVRRRHQLEDCEKLIENQIAEIAASRPEFSTFSL